MKRLAPLLLFLALVPDPGAFAQSASHGHPGKPAAEAPTGGVRLSAALTASETTNVKGGVHWRVFEEQAQADGSHRLVAESREATPSFALPDGAYVVHAAFGLAGATKRIVVDGRVAHERMIMNAGGLRLIDKLGDATIPPQRLAISIYVPERNNSEAKLVLANARAGEVISLPEGPYHIVATLLDTSGAAPGGDVSRELIGAFPSLVLAEGEYVAIARHDGKTYQNSFKVVSTKDSDVEIVVGKSLPKQPDTVQPEGMQ